MEGWYTASQLAGLPGLPGTERGVQKRARRDIWPSRPRQGRGGGREYPFHALPAATRAALTSLDDNPAHQVLALPPSRSVDQIKKDHPGRPTTTIPPAAWAVFLAAYLDRVRPTAAACYQRLKPLAAQEGWQLPSLKTFQRRLKTNLTPQEITLKRHGAHALARRFPPQRRSVAELHAYQWINGDGYDPRPNIRWPDGSVSRGVIWSWQDVYSRKILGWRLDKTENADLIRLTLGDLLERWGIPEHATIDNTRGAANKWLTGRVPNRYRFRIREEDPLGILPRLGIRTHWTGVIEGQGWGQGKPVERAHRDYREYLDKDPALRRAWDRAHALPLADFEGHVARIIQAHNSRPGRRTEMAQALHSFDAVFAHSYARSVIRTATAAQRRLLLLAAESVRVDDTGCVSLQAGRGPNGYNRYHHESLYIYSGDRVVVRFDPQKLHDQVEIETLDGEGICTAACLAPVGFGDTATARQHSRARKQFVKATKAAAQASATAASLAVPDPSTAPEAPDPKPGALRLLKLRRSA